MHQSNARERTLSKIGTISLSNDISYTRSPRW
jgi:hypothetical protein